MSQPKLSKEWLKAFQCLNEPQKRWFCAVKALELGYGGVTVVSLATGMSRTTITQGIHDLEGRKAFPTGEEHQRRSGGGRKESTQLEPKIKEVIENILGESSAGDPMSHLKWTCKSTRAISAHLGDLGIKISNVTVMKYLKEMGYSLRTNKKMLAGKNHPDRNEQFRHINRSVELFSKRGDPVISVDTKKKELVGNFKNGGQIWAKQDREVLDHDFISYGEGKAIPYGAFDINLNEGFVNVGMTSDTSEFAVNSIWQWWRHFGRKHYPHPTSILICADGGGSNGSRARAWKFYLQELANKIGIPISVVHYPPGTSKWNKIEHRLFSYISMNWKGQPLESFESIVKLIATTSTSTGLRVGARLDVKKYKTGFKVSDEDFDKINLNFSKKFPKWNYTIHPI